MERSSRPLVISDYYFVLITELELSELVPLLKNEYNKTLNMKLFFQTVKLTTSLVRLACTLFHLRSGCVHKVHCVISDRLCDNRPAGPEECHL